MIISEQYEIGFTTVLGTTPPIPLEVTQLTDRLYG